MFIPRPLLISIAVVALLVLALSFMPGVPDNAIPELFILGLLITMAIIRVSRPRDASLPSTRKSPARELDKDKLAMVSAEVDALRRHQRQLLLDLPLGVCTIDAEERITTWNRALEKMTSVSADQVQGSRITDLQEPWLSLLHNLMASDYAHLYKQSFDLGDKKRTVNLHKSVIGNAARSDLAEGGILILLEDITETEVLEASLTHSERLASIGRLAAGVAHEIGNPITGIACLAQNIRDEYQDAELRQMAKQIVELTERTSKIVQSLVNFAHAGKPAVSAESDTICVRDCIDEAITLISLDKKGKTMHYEVSCDADITIRGNFQRILQVLLNLINNSRDASQPDSTIHIACVSEGVNVQIVIEDEGIGIAPAVRDRIFDPFFTTKEPGEGTGLGLSLVYSIVEDLAGNIDIISPAHRNTGKGTRVVLTLPAHNNNSLQAAATDEAVGNSENQS